MSYRCLDDGKLSLVIREIPSIHKDGDGRAIPCAVQFIGDVSDRLQMDAMAIYIANDITAFEDFFANLFYVRQGLKIEGHRLAEFVSQFKYGARVGGDLHDALANISKKPSGIFLFIPLSPNFGIDSTVTNNVCRELNMDKKDVLRACMLPSDFIQIQKKAEITLNDNPPVEPEPIPRHAPQESLPESEPSPASQELRLDKDQDTKGLKERVDVLEDEKSRLVESVRALQRELDMHKITISKYKKVIYVLAGASAILLFALGIVGSCSDEKKNETKQPQIENVTPTVEESN